MNRIFVTRTGRFSAVNAHYRWVVDWLSERISGDVITYTTDETKAIYREVANQLIVDANDPTANLHYCRSCGGDGWRVACLYIGHRKGMLPYVKHAQIIVDIEDLVTAVEFKLVI